ncbi:M24 family metallopeptidase [Marinobacter zhanjiangensis]|uniref:Xaa-Pro aminopeptidase n=1 Tax=Marinobacter zhanjiangensis TaxID=578215 RepID=A0ABQ3ATS0_9GAMM|nr:Xaa-Pro peptidase family protein [Marinobacter zhanjiangensis]GGY66061.1 Xaa-Pro aminopeptidase [Marinobacter zhanjiangensis]
MDHNAYRTALTQSSAGTERFFPPAEFTERRSRVARAMAERGLDALLVTDPADIHYLTGYKTFEVSVHAALVFRPEHCFLQVPSIETGPAVTTAWVDEIAGYDWEDVTSVVAPLVSQLRDCHHVGIDPWNAGLRHGLMYELTAHLGGERFQDCGDLLDGIRLIKTAAEIQCLRDSARITEAGLQAAIAMIRPGVDENAIAAAGAGAMLAAGSEFMSLQPIVTSGPRIGVIHLNHQQRLVQPGDPVFLEFGAAWQRYTAPMMRTVVAGEPSAYMLMLRDCCHRIHDALLDTMRPGNRFDDAARAAEVALAPVAGEVFFSGVFGYSVGAQFPPSWVEGTGYIARGQQQRFAPGMVFHLPLCLRLPGQWGIGMSNTVLVTERGAEPLTHNDWELTNCA